MLQNSIQNHSTYTQKSNFQISGDSILFLDQKIDEHFDLLAQGVERVLLETLNMQKEQILNTTPHKQKHVTSARESYEIDYDWVATELTRIAKANIVYNSTNLVKDSRESLKDYLHSKIEDFNSQIDMGFELLKIENVGESNFPVELS